MSRYLSRYVENRVATSFTSLNLWFKMVQTYLDSSDYISLHLSQHSQHERDFSIFLPHLDSCPLLRSQAWGDGQSGFVGSLQHDLNAVWGTARHGTANDRTWRNASENDAKMVRKWYVETATRANVAHSLAFTAFRYPTGRAPQRTWSKTWCWGCCMIPGKCGFRAISCIPSLRFAAQGLMQFRPKDIQRLRMKELWKNSKRTMRQNMQYLRRAWQTWCEHCHTLENGWMRWKNIALQCLPYIALLCLAMYVIVKPLWLKPRSPSALQPPKIRNEIRKEGASVHSLDPHKQNALEWSEWYNMIQRMGVVIWATNSLQDIVCCLEGMQTKRF